MSISELDDRLITYVIFCGFFAVLSLLSWQLMQRQVVQRIGRVPAGMRQPLAGKLLLGTLVGLIALWLMIWPAWFSGAFTEAAPGYEVFDKLNRIGRVDFGTLLRFFSFQSLAEELVYRGFALCLMATGIFSAATRYMRPHNAGARWMHYNWLFSGLAANLLVSVSFAAWHGGNPAITGLGMLNIGLAGLVLGQLFLNQASVAGAAMLHLVWNLGLAVLGLPVSGILVSQPLLGSVRGAGQALISGGSFGPEGSLSCSAALLLVLAYLLWTALPPAAAAVEADPAAVDGTAATALPEGTVPDDTL